MVHITTLLHRHTTHTVRTHTFHCLLHTQFETTPLPTPVSAMHLHTTGTHGPYILIVEPPPQPPPLPEPSEPPCSVHPPLLCLDEVHLLTLQHIQLTLQVSHTQYHLLQHTHIKSSTTLGLYHVYTHTHHNKEELEQCANGISMSTLGICSATN